MKTLVVISILIIIGALINISERLTEIEAHQRVLERQIEDLKNDKG